MYYLYWRWLDSAEHEERKAPYADLEAARGQAEADLERCRDADDYTAAPVRIQDENGAEVWTAPIPDGR